ncbi:MAG: DNA methyltransferase [Rhodobacteraceae bacterium]|nr:DNA methyltransferase [Paracoccaceae bacterium]
MPSVWSDIPSFQKVNNTGEFIGYPTQKPLALLERIIEASSNPDDLVLDPFCGCGTTLHAAHALDRRWIGIARFSVGLVRNRLLRNFRYGDRSLQPSYVRVRGIPETIREARQLARKEPFEFEKWVCSHVGAEGMFHDPGTKGADSGVDGVLQFLIYEKNPKPRQAIIQVKDGNVTPDAVRALDSTVRRFDATAGIMVCFADQMRTVNNNRSRETFTDMTNKDYPVIQGLSVEDMLLRNKQPNLPNIMKMVESNPSRGKRV